MYKLLQWLWRKYPNDATHVEDINQQIKQLQNDVAGVKNKIELFEQVHEKDRQLKITTDRLRHANEDILEKDNELDEVKDEINCLRDKVQEKDRELESMRKTLEEKDSKLERMTDACKQLLMENKSLRSMNELTEAKYPSSTDAQMNKSETKEEFVDPNSQTPHVSATEKLKATNASHGPDTDNRDYTLPRTCQDIRDSSLGCSSCIREGHVTVNYVCDALDDLSIMLKRSGKYYILEDDYNISEVEDIVMKLNDMKNAIEHKRSMEMPKDERDHTLPTTSCQDIPDSSLSFSSSIRKGPDPGPVTVNYVCDTLDDLSSMLKRSGKYYILEDDYNISEVEDIVMKLNDMKRSLEMPR